MVPTVVPSTEKRFISTRANPKLIQDSPLGFVGGGIVDRDLHRLAGFKKPRGAGKVRDLVVLRNGVQAGGRHDAGGNVAQDPFWGSY